MLTTKKTASPIPEAPEFDLMILFTELLQRLHGTGKSPVRFLSLEDDREIEYGRRWRPSALRYCPRKQVYAAHNCKGETGGHVDLGTQFNNFDRGHVFGAWVGAYFRAMEKEGIIQDVHTQASQGQLEMVCRAPELRLAGKADVAFTFRGFKYIVEVKSKDNARTFTPQHKPDQHHPEQLNDYLGMSGRTAGWILYIGPVKADGSPEGSTTTSMKPFFHRFDPELWEKTRGKCKVLDLYYDSPHILAPKTTEVFFQCNQCQYRILCDLEIPPAKAPRW